MRYVPKKLHLDRRAGALVRLGDGEADDLLSTEQVADWFGVSVVWLENNRTKGEDVAPPHIRIGRRVRYRREAVIAWLKAREQTWTGAKQQELAEV